MKKAVFILLVLMFDLICLSQSPFASAAYNPLNQACTDTNGEPIKNSVCQQASNQGDKNPVVDVINTGIKLVGIVVGIASVIMLMIGGFSLVTSAGNTEKIASAKKRIIYALAGLIIAALAWAIVNFVTNRIL